MIASHVPGMYPLGVIWIGAKYLLAAEGFIVIAGVLIGMLYRSLIARRGFKAASLKLLRRALTLYLWLFILTLAVQLFGWATQQAWAKPYTSLTLAQLLWYIATVQVTFYMTDMILMYCLFFACTPLCLWLLHKRLTWLLITGSWLLWLLYQAAAPSGILPLSHITTFHPFAWQIFFVHAVVIGYHHQTIAQFFTRKVRARVFLVTSLVFGCLFVLYILDVAEILTLIGSDHDPWFARSPVRFGRIMIALLTFPFAYLAITYFWKPLQRSGGWLFLPLGSYPFVSYVVHLPLIIASQMLVSLAPGVFNVSPWINRLVPLSAIFIVWMTMKSGARLTTLVHSQRSRNQQALPVDSTLMP